MTKLKQPTKIAKSAAVKVIDSRFFIARILAEARVLAAGNLRWTDAKLSPHRIRGQHFDSVNA